MVHAMEIHGPDSVKSFYEDGHVGDLPLPFVTSCSSYNSVVSETYSDAYNCLTYTDEDVLSADHQRSSLLVQQPPVDLVSAGTDDLTNSLLNTHRDYRLAVLSTVPTTVQSLDTQCNMVEGLTSYTTRNNPTTIIPSPVDVWQLNSPVINSGHSTLGQVPGMNINTLGQSGTILGVGSGIGTGVATGSPNGHHHHHHQQQQQQQQHLSGGSSSHSRGSSTGASTKPKRRRVQTSQQRKAANVRERRRMFHLNEAFDELRKRLPAFNYEKRLSRIETLRLAMTYIGFMKDVTSGKDPCDVDLQKFKKSLESEFGEDDDEDDDDDEPMPEKHRKTHKRQRKFGFYTKDKHELKDFENI